MSKRTHANARENAHRPSWVSQQSLTQSIVWGRLTLAGLYAVFVVALAWALPWVPVGMSAADYEAKTLAVLLFVLTGGALLLANFTLRYRARCIQDALAGAETVRDRVRELRRREFFYDHLVIECATAYHEGYSFAVVIFRVDPAGGHRPEPASLALAAQALSETAPQKSWVAPIGASEVGLVLPEGAMVDLAGMSRLLAGVVAGALDGAGARLTYGWSVYGTDATDPAELIARARERASQTSLATQASTPIARR